ncbi:phosphate/phosphite/phosphonate ABC transporter substrate-binding protein [Thiohalobacter sp. IOR34]|uniref:phosphate/phosphite/phosphonate ABC transporter substrate-binding protein n=1 Tax=Thiohalobacter sp. IOR34 TaxID=3057176 RepID=UPI0025B06656|nr:phosphate/phosphite/phosphonate ABC transporter substrate-binding protein [Thiohalobacter sp. IOR34]WJW75737.1 phosphate/phosphite/phosphonate ABC transporter substrate-binding protein [Thiohalobacter sp. IOR34]
MHRSRGAGRGRRLLPVLLLAFLLGGAEAAEPERTRLVFGFLPIVSPERLVRRFAPLVDHLSQRLGVEVRLETAPDFAEFLRRTHEEQRYDLLFTAPHFYPLARERAGYRALVRVGGPGMRAVIVVPRQSAIRSLQDLRGRRLATVDPLGLATALVRARLSRAGLDPQRDLTLVSTPSHNASLLSAYQGRTDAASLMLPLYRQAVPEVRDGMRILATTAASQHMPISAAPWLDAAEVERIRGLLLGLGADEAGRRLLRRLDWPALVPVADGDYADLGWAAPRLGRP